jgi:type IV pilus assembly protein PilQ
MRFGKNLLVWGLVLVAMAAIAVGQSEQTAVAEAVAGQAVAADVNNAKAGAAQSAAAAEPSPPAEEKVSTDAKIQSISFKKDMRIQDAIQFLAARYQKNIVPSSKVDGMVTVSNLYDVTFEQALNAILGYGFKYDQEGDFIKIYTADEYKKIKEDKERMITKVFTLYYISAAETLKLVAPALSGAGIIQGSSPPEKIMPTGESIGAGSGGGDAMALNDTIVVHDYPENIAKVEKLLQELDVRPRQVLIEATILSATLNEETALGVDWSTLNGVAIDTIVHVGDGSANGAATSKFAEGLQTTHLTGGFSAGITSDHVAVLIRALEEVTDVTVLANPKILAVNKQLGQVYIGKKYGYKSQTTQTQTSTTEQVGFLETGTKLSFRPYIGDDGYIRMDIHPKDSDGSVSDGLPTETSTEVATNIIVKDGQTIVIGGLFRDSVGTTRNQVPLLGNLPIIGAVFRSTVDKVKREEVIVMLTPHIIKEPKETEGIARAEDIRRKRFGAKDELQSISRAKMAEDHYAKAARFFVEGDNESALKDLDSALTLRPTYLEALRLKERIIGQTNPDEAKKLERLILEAIDREEASNWIRR